MVKADPFEMFGRLPAMLNPELISAAMKELLALNLVRSFNLAIDNFLLKIQKKQANKKWIFSGENFWSYFGLVDYFDMLQPRNTCSRDTVR